MGGAAVVLLSSMLEGTRWIHASSSRTCPHLSVFGGYERGRLQSRKTSVPRETWCATFAPEIPVHLRSVNLQENMVGYLPIEITGRPEHGEVQVLDQKYC